MEDEKLQTFIDEYIALVEKHKMCITPSNMLVTNCPFQVEVIYNSLRLAGVLSALGYVKDSTEILAKAIAYLQQLPKFQTGIGPECAGRLS